MNNTIFINSKSINSSIAQNIIKANPKHTVIETSTNTKFTDPKHNLISNLSKDRLVQKRKNIGVLHRNAQWKPDPNGRSTDFLPGLMLSYGCKFYCTYCYVDRRDPVTFPKVYDDALKFPEFVNDTMNNLDKWRKLFVSMNKKDLERYRDPKHPPYVTFDIGCDSDVSVDNSLSRHDTYPGHMVDIINQTLEIPDVMVSFATKSSYIDQFIHGVNKPSRCRIRLSLMPEHLRKIIEINTSDIESRLIAINKLVDAGFEVHINLSPIIITSNFQKEYDEFLGLINQKLSDKAKEQMAYEIIFLTHAEALFDKVNSYAPKAHGLMTNGPLELVPKWNKKNVLSYSRSDKKSLKDIISTLINKHTPYSRIRYMF